MSDTQQIAREKALYRYSHALEQGDFTVVSEVLAQAEGDALLEQMILELNEAQMMAENPVASFDFGNVRGKRPFTLSNLVFNWFNLRQYFTRSRLLFGTIALITIILFGGLFLFSTNRFSSPDLQYQPTAVAYLADAPSASVASYSLLSRSNDTNPANTDASQPTLVPALILPTPEALAQAEAQPRFIVRNGAVQASVEDTLAVKQAIEDRVAEMANEGAFVISSNESGRLTDLPTINIAIRVPVTQFDDMMDWLAAQVAEGTTATRSETADDVTAEFVDLAARVQSLQAARDRLLEIMQNAATTEELLLAEQQLTQRETEIEGLQGRLQYLSQSAQLSRIDITLTPYILSQPPDISWRPAETTRRAYESLLSSGRDLLDFLIIFVIAILPWLIAAGLLLTLVYRFIWRPLRRKRP